MADHSNGGKRLMARHNGSLIIYAVLGILIVTLLYFSWSLNSQVKICRAEKLKLQSDLSHSEGQATKLKTQVQGLSDELQAAIEKKNSLETERDKQGADLKEAKESLVGSGRGLM